MDNNELVKAVEDSPALLDLKNRLEAELEKTIGDMFAFDPFLIIAMISLIIQVIIFCKNRKDDDNKVLRDNLRRLNKLPPGKTLLLRRRLNKLWQEKYAGARKPGWKNPLVTAVYAVSANMSDDESNELFGLADKFTK
jgi:hypothetical protein